MPPKKPIQVIDFKKHKKSKKEMERRANSEIKIGGKNFTVPDILRGNATAVKKWNELSGLYGDVDYVSTADTDIIAQYCICFSEYETLVKTYKKVLKECKDNGKTATETSEILNKSNIDNMINKKREALQKTGTKIFLDPTARIKAIPVKEPEKPASPLEQFGVL